VKVTPASRRRATACRLNPHRGSSGWPGRGETRVASGHRQAHAWQHRSHAPFMNRTTRLCRMSFASRSFSGTAASIPSSDARSPSASSSICFRMSNPPISWPFTYSCSRCNGQECGEVARARAYNSGQYLGVGGPVAELFQPLPHSIVTEDVERVESDGIASQQGNRLAAETAAGFLPFRQHYREGESRARARTPNPPGVSPS